MDCQNKRCSRCGQVKALDEFYKRPGRSENCVQYICKLCSKIATKEQRLKNPAPSRKAARKWQSSHPEEKKAITKKWIIDHPEAVKEMHKRSDAKRLSTPDGRLNNNIATKLRASLRGGKGSCHWEEIVGYSSHQLKKHLQKHFQQGMTWENYGKWHVDHKIPIVAFNFETPDDIDFKRCWALKNLQPLWAKDNNRKRDKIEKTFQPSLTI